MLTYSAHLRFLTTSNTAVLLIVTSSNSTAYTLYSNTVEKALQATDLLTTALAAASVNQSQQHPKP